MRPVTIVALLLAPVACASGPKSRPKAESQPAEPAQASVELTASSLKQAPVGDNLAVALPSGKTGVRKAELMRVQKEGPHWLLQRIKVRPVLRKGRFVGWRVMRYDGPGKLEAGVIVRRVNGSSLERPEQLMEVWNAMTSRDTIDIESIQAGKREQLAFPVVTDD
jgi:type II secretory pathway component PulC